MCVDCDFVMCISEKCGGPERLHHIINACKVDKAGGGE